MTNVRVLLCLLCTDCCSAQSSFYLPRSRLLALIPWRKLSKWQKATSGSKVGKEMVLMATQCLRTAWLLVALQGGCGIANLLDHRTNPSQRSLFHVIVKSKLNHQRCPHRIVGQPQTAHDSIFIIVSVDRHTYTGLVLRLLL